MTNSPGDEVEMNRPHMTDFKKKTCCGGEFDDVMNPENEAHLSNAFSNNISR